MPSEHTLTVRCEAADLSYLQDWETELYTGAYEIRRKGEQRFLVHHWMTHRFAFGMELAQLYSGEHLCLYCNSKVEERIVLTTSHFLSMAGIHHRLMQNNATVLHAAYISHKGRGILFAAPSQTGKSTQAELWVKYAGAELLNGDRALVFLRDGLWYAGGYIASGSSCVCRNKSYPLSAIVFLEQGKENLIYPTTGKERIRGLLAGMETFHWSTEDLDLALSLADRMSTEIPILRYSCRPDEDAVHTLEQYLEAISL